VRTYVAHIVYRFYHDPPPYYFATAGVVLEAVCFGGVAWTFAFGFMPKGAVVAKSAAFFASSMVPVPWTIRLSAPPQPAMSPAIKDTASTFCHMFAVPPVG
jgi:hypothetical protein